MVFVKKGGLNIVKTKDNLKIEMLDIDSLKMYENNPRKNDEAVKYVENSIKEFGFKVPIIIDKNKTIVAGHTRYKASKNLRLKSVPCLIADDLDDEQIKAFRLADNKVSEFSDWDQDLLDSELDDLKDLDIDMSDFGFDLDDLDDDEHEIIEDEVPEVPEEPISKYGGIYQLGKHRLMCGDSTKVEDVEILMNGAKADMVFTDPPYGINVVKSNQIGGGGKTHFGKIGGGKIVKASSYREIIGDDTTETAKLNYEIIKKFSQEQIIFGGNYFTDFLYPSRCWIVWDKQNTGNFADAELAWTSYDKSVKLYTFTWNGMTREGSKKVEGKKRVHPTQKPVGLITNILNDFKDWDGCGIVLDCFGGSGSTLIACEQLNLKCYMMELDPKYVDVIIKRWETFTNKKAVKLND